MATLYSNALSIRVTRCWDLKCDRGRDPTAQTVIKCLIHAKKLIFVYIHIFNCLLSHSTFFFLKLLEYNYGNKSSIIKYTYFVSNILRNLNLNVVFERSSAKAVYDTSPLEKKSSGARGINAAVRNEHASRHCDELTKRWYCVYVVTINKEPLARPARWHYWASEHQTKVLTRLWETLISIIWISNLFMILLSSVNDWENDSRLNLN